MACLANNTSTYVRMVRKKELLTKIDSGLYKSAIYGVKSIEGARSWLLQPQSPAKKHQGPAQRSQTKE